MARKDEDDTAHKVPDLNFVRAQGRTDRLTYPMSYVGDL